MHIRIGGTVPIQFQADDGNQHLAVKGKIYRADDTLMKEVTLTHRAHGLYTFQDFPMPNEEFITVQYFCSEVDLYGVPVDTFYRELPDITEGYAVGVIVNSEPADDFALGVIE